MRAGDDRTGPAATLSGNEGTPAIRHDEASPGAGPAPAGTGRARRCTGRPRSRPWTPGRVAWLLAAAIGLSWLATPRAGPRDLPVHQSRGHPGVEIQGFAISPDGH